MSVKGVYRITAQEAERRAQLTNPNVRMFYETYCGVKGICKWMEIGIEGEFWCVPDSLKCGLTKGNPVNSLKRRYETNLEKYGVENIFQDKERVADGVRSKYGVDNFYERTDLLKDIYIEKLGVENPFQRVDIIQKSCFEKYGVRSTSMLKEVQDKIAISSNNTTVVKHWKTNEDLSCRASWEPKVVQYLNINKIDYEWQPGPYILSNGKSYRPDILLIEDGIFIEIKGYKRPKSMEKWNLFIQDNPNSELWDRDKLQQMGIIK